MEPHWAEYGGALIPLPSLELEHYVYRLSNLPYRERRQLLRSDAFSGYPRFTYRYLGTDGSDISRDRLRYLLVRSRLWLSAPTDFNDPFEMSVNYVVEGSREDLRRGLKSRFEQLSRRLTKEQRLSARKKAELISSNPDGFAKELKQFQQMLANASGVCCLADDPRSILMWSHYGRNHMGVCLQFELVNDPLLFLRAVSVHYSEHYPSTINWVDERQFLKDESMFVKFEAWRYERERRVLVLGGARKWLSFRPEACSGIILGARASSDVRRLVDDLIAERRHAQLPELWVYRAKLHSRDYRLNIFSENEHD